MVCEGICALVEQMRREVLSARGNDRTKGWDWVRMPEATSSQQIIAGQRKGIPDQRKILRSKERGKRSSRRGRAISQHERRLWSQSTQSGRIPAHWTATSVRRGIQKKCQLRKAISRPEIRLVRFAVIPLQSNPVGSVYIGRYELTYFLAAAFLYANSPPSASM
jgi:hypothetical protein